jgi:hypothetical protein
VLCAHHTPVIHQSAKQKLKFEVVARDPTAASFGTKLAQELKPKRRQPASAPAPRRPPPRGRGRFFGRAAASSRATTTAAQKAADDTAGHDIQVDDNTNDDGDDGDDDDGHDADDRQEATSELKLPAAHRVYAETKDTGVELVARICTCKHKCARWIEPLRRMKKRDDACDAVLHAMRALKNGRAWWSSQDVLSPEHVKAAARRKYPTTKIVGDPPMSPYMRLMAIGSRAASAPKPAAQETLPAPGTLGGDPAQTSGGSYDLTQRTGKQVGEKLAPATTNARRPRTGTKRRTKEAPACQPDLQPPARPAKRQKKPTAAAESILGVLRSEAAAQPNNHTGRSHTRGQAKEVAGYAQGDSTRGGVHAASNRSQDDEDSDDWLYTSAVQL